jgi:hypothetical protein
MADSFGSTPKVASKLRGECDRSVKGDHGILLSSVKAGRRGNRGLRGSRSSEDVGRIWGDRWKRK